MGVQKVPAVAEPVTRGLRFGIHPIICIDTHRLAGRIKGVNALCPTRYGIEQEYWTHILSKLDQVCRIETYSMGNMMRVMVFVRTNRIINDSSCMLDTGRDSREMSRTTDLIGHAPPSKHFDT